MEFIKKVKDVIVESTKKVGTKVTELKEKVVIRPKG